ncbi:MAG: transglycosylase SLT domain-containing protein [Gammaproteobacteria bacterium]|nr:transglycosylase SLT domain-containing protein [Gammaproteobacteria bacterium]MDH5651761.1 transglycosylase SLT domain-containing protein [Gammaproteobacteria bacterium]
MGNATHDKQTNSFTRQIIFSVTVLLSAALPASCASHSDEQEQNLKIIAWDENKNSQQLVSYTKEALLRHGRDLLTVVPKDISRYCPRYTTVSRQERLQFWSALISGLAWFESNHSSAVRYKERFADVRGKAVISRGLLQISRESANAYGCDITEANQLHNPKVNINCGVKILNKWVGQEDQVIAQRRGGLLVKETWLGAAKYWSPFRDYSRIRSLARALKELPFCKSDANTRQRS